MVSVGPHDLTPWRILRAITVDIMAMPEWGRPPLRIDRLNPGPYWGRTDRRTWVAYADPAPLSVVAHELAHVSSGEHGHGDRWAAHLRGWWEIVAQLRAARYPASQQP